MNLRHSPKQIDYLRAVPMLIILMAFGLRIWLLDAQALSGDEAFSIISWTRSSLERLLTEIAVIDPQPPVALLSLYGWVRLVGDSVFAARMLSVLMGTVAVAACYTLTTQLLGRQVGLIAAILAAINPFLIWHSQDLRSYGLWIGLSALTLAALVRAFRRPSLPNWGIYVVLAALSAYTYYLEAFLLIVHNIYALNQLLEKRELISKWVISQLAIALLLAPWFLQPSLRESGYQPTAGPPDIIGAFHTFLFGATLPPQMRTFTPNSIIPPLVTLFVAIVMMAALIYGIRRTSVKVTALTIPAAVFPVIALAALAWITSKGYFHPRYVVASAIPTLILVANLVTPRTSQGTINKFAQTTLLAILCGLSAASLIAYHTDPRVAKAPQWSQIVRLLEQQMQPDDLVLRNYLDPAFTYYYTGSVELQTLPEGEDQTLEQTSAKLKGYAQSHDHIWFMPVETNYFDRDHVVDRWLDENLQLVSEQYVGATRILQYGSWTRNEPEVAIMPAPKFGNLIQLKGYRLTPNNNVFLRGETIYIELFWEPLDTSTSSLKFYVHLIGPNTPSGIPLWAQDDHYPQMGRINSLSWLSGEVFPDVYRIEIPDNAAAGEYWLTAGLYDPDTNLRVPLSEEAHSIDTNSAILLSFQLP